MFRALNKYAKFLFGTKLKAELLPRSIFYLKKLKFPPATTVKILEGYASALEIEGKKDERHKMSLNNLLALGIISL